MRSTHPIDRYETVEFLRHRVGSLLIPPNHYSPWYLSINRIPRVCGGLTAQPPGQEHFERTGYLSMRSTHPIDKNATVKIFKQTV